MEASVILSYNGKNINVECNGKILEVESNDEDKTETLVVELENVDIDSELTKHTDLKLFEEQTAKLKSLNKSYRHFNFYGVMMLIVN